MLKIERINFFFENAIRGRGPYSGPPPSEIFENVIKGAQWAQTWESAEN